MVWGRPGTIRFRTRQCRVEQPARLLTPGCGRDLSAYTAVEALGVWLQCAEGVDIGAAQQNLEVQVRPGRSAGRADGSKTLTGTDKLSGGDVD